VSRRNQANLSKSVQRLLEVRAEQSRREPYKNKLYEIIAQGSEDEVTTRIKTDVAGTKQIETNTTTECKMQTGSPRTPVSIAKASADKTFPHYKALQNCG
jgi:hypothetical protein